MDISQAATKLIKPHEGLKLKMYRDTRGVLTIGYGFNLEVNSIPQDVAERLLEVTLEPTITALRGLSWFQGLDVPRQAAIVDMAFNLGVHGLLGFNTFLQLIQAGQWEQATQDLLGTKWAQQVGTRATQDSEIIRTGILPSA